MMTSDLTKGTRVLVTNYVGKPDGGEPVGHTGTVDEDAFMGLVMVAIDGAKSDIGIGPGKNVWALLYSEVEVQI